jgi:hypothetical protein
MILLGFEHILCQILTSLILLGIVVLDFVRDAENVNFFDTPKAPRPGFWPRRARRPRPMSSRPTLAGTDTRSLRHTNFPSDFAVCTTPVGEEGRE